MSNVIVHLFGKLQVQRGDQVLDSLKMRKTQELFVYLLLHRNRLHCREALASLLWDKSTTTQSLKYLRQTLWQLQVALDSANGDQAGSFLQVDSEWVGLNVKANLWLDVAEFEQAFTQVQGVLGSALDAKSAEILHNVVPLYQGDLLENWYQDWCLYERERLQNMYLAMLDKLMGYYEIRHEYETALEYGGRILRYDQAREHIHRRLMRLQYLAGDRTTALRQYECCAAVLDDELGVKPAKRTMALYEQIRADQLNGPTPAPAKASQAVAAPLLEILGRLKQFRSVLTDTQCQIEQDIQAVEQVLNNQR